MVLVELELYYWTERMEPVSNSQRGLYLLAHLDCYESCLTKIPEENRRHRALCLEELFKLVINTPYVLKKTLYYQDANAKGAAVFRRCSRAFVKSDINWAKKLALLIFYHVPVLHKAYLATVVRLKTM